MPSPLSQPVAVNGISVAGLTVSQGSLDRARPIYNRDPSFAATNIAPDLVLVKSSIPVFICAFRPEGDVNLIRWQLDRDPLETDPTIPLLSGSSGQSVSFQPSAGGNFRLTAYVDLNANQHFDLGEQLFVVRFAIVQVSVQGTENFRSGLRFMRTGEVDAPVSGMSLDAYYLLEGGGPQRTIGTSAIGIGNIGNLIGDTFRVDYPPTARNPTPGTGTESPGGSIPMLDTSKSSYCPGGSGPFRGNSTRTILSGSPLGVSIRLSSYDNPQFSWAEFHPVTGNRFVSMSGGNSFREFVVAFSSFFPNVYAPLYQADWTAAACVGGRITIAPSAPASPSSPPVVNGSSFAASMSYSPPGNGPITSGKCPSKGVWVPSQELMNFALGQAVGGALASGCDLLYGELLTDSPRTDRPVEVRVKRAFLGSFSQGEIVNIRYASLGTSPKSGDTLAHAWDHVTFSQRTPVMVILTRRQMGDVRAGDPVLVTSRTREFQIILSLVEEAAHLANLPHQIGCAVDLAVCNRDSALTGYLCARLWHQEGVDDPQLCSELLIRMLGGPSAPPEAWPELAEDIVLPYVLLSVRFQTAIVARFLELARRVDLYAGFAGFRGLGKIASFSSLAVPTESISGLVSAYRRLVKYDGMPREFALETALSIVLDLN
jgi:hypothetical protein